MIEDIYEDMGIVLLNESDVKRIAEYINEKPFLWTGYMTNISIAVTYGDYKFICTGYAEECRPVIIMTPDSISYNYVYFKNGADNGVVYSTGNDELDEILRNVSFVSPIDETELAWLVRKFYGIDESEYSESYEEARSKVIIYDSEMTKKYLPDIKQKRLDFFKDKKYSTKYYDL